MTANMVISISDMDNAVSSKAGNRSEASLAEKTVASTDPTMATTIPPTPPDVSDRTIDIPSPATEAPQSPTSRTSRGSRQGSRQDLICFYDEEPTQLYSHLEREEWAKAADRAKSHPVEAKTWVARKDKKDPDKVRWKLLPLHAAIIFKCPIGVVEVLLEAFPTACSLPDDQGMLPLHLAFRHRITSEELLELLLVQYPKAVHIVDRRDRLPLEHGREGMFSAKTLRLHSDAAVATASSIGLPGLTSTKGSAREAQIKEEYEKHLIRQSEDYESQIATLKSAYEENLTRIHTEKQTTERELYRAQNTITEWEGLRRELEQTKAERDMLTTLLKGMKVYNDQMTENVKKLKEDQLTIRNLYRAQQEKVAKSQVAREELLQALVKQCQADKETTQADEEMDSLLGSLEARVEDALSRAPPLPPVDDDDHKIEAPPHPGMGGAEDEAIDGDDISAITDDTNSEANERK